MVFGFMDQLFNNTIYRFEKGLEGSSGNRSNILGNLVLDCHTTFMGQNRPGDASMMGGGDTGEMGRTGIPTMAYASNVFFGSPKGNRDKTDAFGYVGGTKATLDAKAPVHTGNTLEELRDKLAAEKCRLATIGWHVETMPLVDPANRDYRPGPGSGAAGRGVKYFVPWALARTVGEWNFFKSDASPQVVLGEGYYMTDEYVDRATYYYIPRNDLVVSQCAATDYLSGELEDWITGALAFDGARVATLSHAEMTRNVEYPGGRRSKARSYDGAKRETVDMGANDFLIEIVFRTDPGRTGGVLVSKSADAGYELAVGARGAPCLTLRSGGATTSANATARVDDGAWHHVLVEVDRAAGRAAFYVDGRAAGEAALDAIARDASLANTADFVVGKGLNGAIDFLRVCRSTLAGSKTTIEELYAWEFDGPHLRDFTGRSPAGMRDAGAMQGE
jgi:hypothetical protein